MSFQLYESFSNNFLIYLMITVLISILLAIIFFRCKRFTSKIQSKPKDGIPTIIFFGSGGHTTEMIALITKLNPTKYYPTHFVISHSDVTSVEKVKASQCPLIEHATWHRIYRSREVKQSWITTIFSTIRSSYDSLLLVYSINPSLIICNGPGTCVPICYIAYILNWIKKVLLMQSDTYLKIVFVESFCRVETLSLTGKLLYPLVDKFIVQWPMLAKKYPQTEYLGTIC